MNLYLKGNYRSTLMQSTQDYFYVRNGDGYTRILPEELLYIEASTNYSVFVCKNKKLSVLLTMRQLEKQLRGNLCCRIHRSYIVCIRQVLFFSQSKVMIDDGQRTVELPVGHVYRHELIRRVNLLQTLKHESFLIA
jgi:two-component system response regulator LytT